MRSRKLLSRSAFLLPNAFLIDQVLKSLSLLLFFSRSHESKKILAQGLNDADEEKKNTFWFSLLQKRCLLQPTITHLQKWLVLGYHLSLVTLRSCRVILIKRSFFLSLREGLLGMGQLAARNKAKRKSILFVRPQPEQSFEKQVFNSM